MDYDSIPITTSLTAGTTSIAVNVSLTKNNIAERSETFDISFNISSSLNGQVILGNITNAVGNITDDTGKIILL